MLLRFTSQSFPANHPTSFRLCKVFAEAGHGCWGCWVHMSGAGDGLNINPLGEYSAETGGKYRRVVLWVVVAVVAECENELNGARCMQGDKEGVADGERETSPLIL